MSDVIDCRSTPVTSRHITCAMQRSRGKGSDASRKALLETSWLSCTLTLQLANLIRAAGLRAGGERCQRQQVQTSR